MIERSPESAVSDGKVGIQNTTSNRQPILIANPGADLYGSDRVLLETVSALVSLGNRVIVTVPHKGPLVAHIEQRGGEIEIVRTPVLRKSALRPKGMAGLLRDVVAGIRPSVRLLRRLKPQLILVNTITPPLWFLLARVLGIPVVCHVHEAEKSVPRWQQLGLNAPLLLADHLIVNSEFSLHVLSNSFSTLRGRSSVIYNAVPGPPTKPIAPRANLHGDLRLLYVGRLSARKGPDVAIVATKLLVDRGIDAHLDLVGAVAPGYEKFDRHLHSLVSEHQLEGHVTFHGFQRDVWAFSARTDVNLVPSTLDEPFGNTAVEAALAGRPLVVSEISGLIEASDGLTSCIRVEAGSADEIADAAETIMHSWTEYRTSALIDAEFAADRYSFSRYQKSIAEVVDNATCEPHRRC